MYLLVAMLVCVFLGWQLHKAHAAEKREALRDKIARLEGLETWDGRTIRDGELS